MKTAIARGKHIYLKKLLLNLTTLATEVGLIWVAYKAFTHKLTPMVGVLSVIALVILLWYLIRLSKRRSLRYQRPRMIKTAMAILALLVIFAFAGVQPMASYKDAIFNKVMTFTINQQIKAEARATQKRLDEEGRLAEIGMKNPSQVVEAIQGNKELQIGIEVVELVNAIRKERSSPQLLWDDKLYEYSLAHSQNMAKQKRLFHTDINLPYGENAWGGEGSQSWGAKTIVESWMTSPAHRTWLLCPNLKKVAVGVAYSTNGMYASWTFWIAETMYSDWWYQYTPDSPPEWWY